MRPFFDSFEEFSCFCVGDRLCVFFRCWSKRVSKVLDIVENAVAFCAFRLRLGRGLGACWFYRSLWLSAVAVLRWLFEQKALLKAVKSGEIVYGYLSTFTSMSLSL